VIGDESEGGDCDEVICAGWGEPGRQWTECVWRNEEGSWNHTGVFVQSVDADLHQIWHDITKQESRVVARKPRDAACFCLQPMTHHVLFTFTA